MLQMLAEIQSGRRQPDDFRPELVKTIARGHSSKLAERHEAKCRSVRREETSLDGVIPDSGCPLDNAVHQDELGRLLFEITQLGQRDRELLDRVFVKGQSLRGIADQTDQPEHRVRRRYHAILQALRTSLNHTHHVSESRPKA